MSKKSMFLTGERESLLKGLVSVYKLDDSLEDVKNELDLLGVPVYIGGKDGSALSINDDWTNCAYKSRQPQHVFTGAFSISFWVKRTTYSTAIQYLISRRTGNQYLEYACWLQSTNIYFDCYSDDANKRIRTLKPFPTSLNVWQHIVISHNGDLDENGMDIYVNNSSSSMTKSNSGIYTGIRSTNAYLTLGALATAPPTTFAYPLKGDIEEVLMYDRKINVEEVSRLYNNGDGLFHPFK